jgi:hypothetical protein
VLALSFYMEVYVTERTDFICPECQGDGYFLYTGGPGRFDAWLGTWMPEEVQVVCECCHGTGAVGAEDELAAAPRNHLDRDEVNNNQNAHEPF